MTEQLVLPKPPDAAASGFVGVFACKDSNFRQCRTTALVEIGPFRGRSGGGWFWFTDEWSPIRSAEARHD